MLVLTYHREFTEGHWRKKEWEIPIHAFYEDCKEDVPLFFKFLTLFLPMASADRAFLDCSSVCDILNAAVAWKQAGLSENKELEVIRFAENVQDLPVFRPFEELHADKSTGRA